MITSGPVNLRTFDRPKVRETTRIVDSILRCIPTKDITESRDLISSATILVGEMIGWKVKKARLRKDPWWKHRVEGDIKTLRKTLAGLKNGVRVTGRRGKISRGRVGMEITRSKYLVWGQLSRGQNREYMQRQ